MHVLLILFLLLLGGIAGYLLARYVIHPEGGSIRARRDPADAALKGPARGGPVVDALPPPPGARSGSAGAASSDPHRQDAPEVAPERPPTMDAAREDGGPHRAAAGRAGASASDDYGASRPEQRASERAAAVEVTSDAASGEAAGMAPDRLDRPDEADDLKRISGIGPTIERTLNDLGIYRFAQIAAFTPENIVWVDRHLRFKGRIEREEWVGQARTLIAEREGLGAGAERPRQGATGPLH